MTDTLRLIEDLIARPSVTPDDRGCQALIAARLEAAGFHTEHLPFGPVEFRVSNLWAVRTGSSNGPTVVFAGHTDVVPAGPLSSWASDPFVPSYRDGKLRMKKGSPAADDDVFLGAVRATRPAVVTVLNLRFGRSTPFAPVKLV